MCHKTNKLNSNTISPCFNRVPHSVLHLHPVDLQVASSPSSGSSHLLVLKQRLLALRLLVPKQRLLALSCSQRLLERTCPLVRKRKEGKVKVTPQLEAELQVDKASTWELFRSRALSNVDIGKIVAVRSALPISTPSNSITTSPVRKDSSFRFRTRRFPHKFRLYLSRKLKLLFQFVRLILMDVL